MKTNKLLFILFLSSLCTFSQSILEEKKEKINSLKIGFITNELALTTEEASKFWPIYNAYDDKQFEIRHQKMRVLKRRMNADIEKMTEKDASALLIQMESTEDELYQMRKKFVNNLKGVLPSVKILQLKKAEDDFNRKLLQQYRNKGPQK